MSEELETIEIFGVRGRLIINKYDMNIWRAKGYKTKEEFENEKAQEIKSLPIEKDIKSMTIAGLKEYAEQNGIDISGLTKKADIIEAIEKAQAKEPE
jgi:predicted DNA binding CopG/RHH family protein